MKFGSLQVRTPDGAAREFPIDLPSLVVGRADGNGIVIDDLSISRRHAKIVIESGRLLVEDLGSAAGTFVGGHRIDPGTTNLVEGDQDIRFGDVHAQFVPAPAGTAEESGGVDGEVLAIVEEAPSKAIALSLTPPAGPVEPGGAVFASILIHNRGRVVDLVALSVSGIPSAWVTFNQQTLALVPGSRETVTMVIQPPVGPESLAGEYDFGVVVNSGEHEREVEAFGKLQVLPFDAAELSLNPVRSSRDFVVIAKNNGNSLVTYGLSGVDEEAQFIYDFDAPAIELQPGTEKRVPLRVKKRKRQLFGRTVYAPLRVIATPTTDSGIQVETPGQLLVRPPLERWKAPAIFALLLALLGLAFWLSWIYRDQIPTWIPWSTKEDTVATDPGNPEAVYAGVHMCDKTQEERDEANSKQTPPPAGTSGAPLFAQTNAAWADIEYAKAQDPEFGPDWCGTTIEQCGCAMTSVATIMAMFNIVTMPDGSELTPLTVNAWFNDQAEKTARGWVSKGYVYGDVIWTAANELSGQIAKQRPGSPTLRFAGFGTGAEDEIRAELEAGRPVVVEVPGHYIAAVGINNEGKILINDPYYSDRLTLDSYKGKVKSSVLFEPSADLSGVAITVPKDLRVRVVDKQGKVVGTLTGEQPTGTESNGIPGAFFSSREAWRDPTCIESPPPPGAGTTTVFLPGNREDYRIEVLNPSAGGTSVAIHSYDQDGNAAVQSQDSTGPSVIGISFDPRQAEVELQVIQGTTPGSGSGTPAFEGTPVFPTGGGNAGGGTATVTNPSATASPSPVVSPTPTRTAVPTPAPVAPQSVTVQCDVAYTPQSAGVTCTGNVSGTYTTTRWTMNGLPAPVPPGSTAFSTTFTQDTTATVEMTACNVTACRSGSTSVVVKFSSATPTPTGTPVPGTPTPTPTIPPVGPPASVSVQCSYQTIGSAAEINCGTSFPEAYNTITWTANGGADPAFSAGGAKHFTTFVNAPATVNVQANVCLGSTCTLSNVAVVNVGTPSTPPPSPQFMSIHIDNVCPTAIPNMDQSVLVFLDSWTPDLPYPGGTISLFMDGNLVGTAPPDSGEPYAFFTVFVPAGMRQFLAQYTGDANWTAASASCTSSAG